MYDFYKLNRELRMSEHETASALNRQLLEAGFTQEKAIALIYRAGIIDGRAFERERSRRTEYYKALSLAAKQSLPEATSADHSAENNEGDITND